MGKKFRSKNSLLRHALIIAPAAIGLLYSSWRLLSESDLLPFDPDGRPLAGEISHAEGDVKRRPPKRLRWFRAPKQSKIYSQDTVRTAPNGMTQVLLPDGAEILLGPSSLAVFVREGGRARVSVASGQAQFKSGTGALVVESQGKEIRVEAGGKASGWVEARSGAGIDPEASVKLLGGKAEVVGLGLDKTKAVGLKVDALVSWGAGATTPLEKATGEMLSPSPDAEIFISPKQKSLSVEFKLSRPNAQLEIAREGDFSRPVFANPVESKSTTVQLAPGQYRWRAWFKGELRPLPARGFSILEGPAETPKPEPAPTPTPTPAPAPVAVTQVPVVPAPVVPAPSTSAALPEIELENSQGTRVSNAYDAKGLKKDLSIRIAWKAVPGAKSYRIRFSTQASMEKPFLERGLEESHYVIARESLKASQVYYQIEALMPDGRAGKSRVTPFVFDFSPPRLVAPAEDYVLLASGLAPNQGGSVMMTWEKTNYTQAYRVEVARDPGFKKIVQSKEIKENFTLIQRPAPGDYYWRVRSLAPPVVSDPSAVRHFKVK